jgi:lysophospholipase L1-like esterase
MSVRSVLPRCVCLLVVSSALYATDTNSLPAPRREPVEWCDIRISRAPNTTDPRVLLIGDSIASGYFEPVVKMLKDTLNCTRFSTSRSICDPVFYKELQLLFDEYTFDIIHVNNGLHGWDYTEAEYEDALQYLLTYLKEQMPDATIIWASTTPMREPEQLQKPAKMNTRVKKRNTLANEIMQKNKIEIVDLYMPAVYHQEWYRADGIHLNAQGNEKLGAYVAETVKNAYFERLSSLQFKTPSKSLYETNR